MEDVMLQNAVEIKEGEDVYILNSQNRHDCKTYKTEDGTLVLIDGGSFGGYTRSSGLNHPSVTNLSLSSDSSFSEIIDKLVWGTLGKDGKQNLTFKRIRDLETDHLINILRDIKGLHWLHEMVIKFHLWNRKKQ